eukprot:14297516-Alexandrium_andersonii.AAC.1
MADRGGAREPGAGGKAQGVLRCDCGGAPQGVPRTRRCPQGALCPASSLGGRGWLCRLAGPARRVGVAP